jgi:hypothetical protein
MITEVAIVVVIIFIAGFLTVNQTYLYSRQIYCIFIKEFYSIYTLILMHIYISFILILCEYFGGMILVFYFCNFTYHQFLLISCSRSIWTAAICWDFVSFFLIQSYYKWFIRFQNAIYLKTNESFTVTLYSA